jgi:hypothetical protein
MSLSLVLLIALVIAVFIIKSKINAIHRNIENKLHAITSVTNFGENLADKVKKAVRNFK